jgi:hypothetical protein
MNFTIEFRKSCILSLKLYLIIWVLKLRIGRVLGHVAVNVMMHTSMGTSAAKMNGEVSWPSEKANIVAIVPI